jgi:hypothetical protein
MAEVQPLRWGMALAMLASRTVFFVIAQVLIAVVLSASGIANAWRESAYWWPISATLGSGASLIILHTLLRREGLTLWDLYKPDRKHVVQDILVTLGMTAIGALLVSMPRIWSGLLLFGDSAVPNEMMFRPLPLAVAVACIVLFPLSVGLSELPTYFGFLMPRLKALSGRWWIALLLAGFWLAAQHMALPVIFDWHFLLWRLVMFLPFALYTGAFLAWRPRLLPYFIFVHILLDLTTAVFLLP